MKENNYSDILVYSGYEFSYLKLKFPQILELIDVVIDGKFMQGQETEYIWKGSENKNMNILTKDKILREKYLKYREIKSEKRKLQIIDKNDKVYVLGIPNQKDSRAIRNGFQ